MSGSHDPILARSGPWSRFTDVFPLTKDEAAIPAVRWSQSLPTPYVPVEGEMFGLPTGSRNGVWVLDLDRKGGKDGLAAIQAHMIENDLEDLPETFTVGTRSGGLHLYFALPSGEDPEGKSAGTSEKVPTVGNRISVLPGVDVRGEGGYVRAGGPYTVKVPVAPQPAPAWLLELVTRKRGEAAGVSAIAISPEHKDWDYRVGKAAEYLRHAPVCVSGKNGQKQIWAVCLYLARTLELPIATSMELVKGYNTRCEPPWELADWSRTLQRAAEHGETPVGIFASDFLMTGAPPSAEDPAGKSASEDGGSEDPSGKSAGRLTVDPTREWRRGPGVARAGYVWDLATGIQGTCQINAISQRDLTACLTGPGANPQWCGVFQWDDFRRKIVAVDPPMKLHAEVTGFDGVDLANMQVYFACMGYKVPLAMLENAVATAADAASFHPIRDYLDALPPMSLEDADAYFTGVAARLWGAAEDRAVLESGALRRFAVAAVRRVRRPGTKVDTMLILAGPQGWNKSQFAEKLFGSEHFRNQMPPLDSKEASAALEGMWGIEMAELTRLSRSQEDTKKEFLSRREDKYRPAYARHAVVLQRQCVFLGTTNDDEFLSDPTGARRYDVCELRQAVDLTFDRDEFWRAANALEAAGEKHWRDHVDDADDPQAAANRHAQEDVWTEPTLRYLKGREEITAVEVMTYALTLAMDRQDARAKNRVAGILRRHCGPAKVTWKDGRAQRLYVVPGRFR